MLTGANVHRALEIMRLMHLYTLPNRWTVDADGTLNVQVFLPRERVHFCLRPEPLESYCMIATTCTALSAISPSTVVAAALRMR